VLDRYTITTTNQIVSALLSSVTVDDLQRSMKGIHYSHLANFSSLSRVVHNRDCDCDFNFAWQST